MNILQFFPITGLLLAIGSLPSVTHACSYGDVPSRVLHHVPGKEVATTNSEPASTKAVDTQESGKGCRDKTTQVVDVRNPVTDKTWMDRNLGASQQATSHFQEAAYGDLYQWGRCADGHQKENSATIITLSGVDQPPHGQFIQSTDSPYDWRSPQNDNLWQGVNGLNNPCPEGYRIPTSAEWEEERNSWSEMNIQGALDSPLRLPGAGERRRIDMGDGNLLRPHEVGGLDNLQGYYWSSTTEGQYAYYFNFSIFGGGPELAVRDQGASVRCLKD